MNGYYKFLFLDTIKSRGKCTVSQCFSLRLDYCLDGSRVAFSFCGWWFFGFCCSFCFVLFEIGVLCVVLATLDLGCLELREIRLLPLPCAWNKGKCHHCLGFFKM